MTRAQTIESLGGADIFGTDIRSEIEFVERIEKGLPASAADALQELCDLTGAELGEIAPRRTLSRARKR